MNYWGKAETLAENILERRRTTAQREFAPASIFMKPTFGSAVINHKVINKTIKGKNLPLPLGSAISLPNAILARGELTYWNNM